MNIKRFAIILSIFSFSGTAQAATLESAGISFQIVFNIYGLVNNMRDNAKGYKSDLASNRLTIQQLSDNMKGDAVQYKRRLKFLADLDNRNTNAVTDSLAALNLDRTEVFNLMTSLKNTSQAVIDAEIINATEINTISDQIIAAVPNYERLY